MYLEMLQDLIQISDYKYIYILFKLIIKIIKYEKRIKNLNIFMKYYNINNIIINLKYICIIQKLGLRYGSNPVACPNPVG